MAGSKFKYGAFISYSHAKDRPLATALQSVMQSLGKAWWQRRAMRVFRDETSLTATPSLWPTIQKALASSEYLVLMASPEAGRSVWVGREVSEWLAVRGPEEGPKRILVCLTDGELEWNHQSGDFIKGDNRVLPPSLTGKFPSEPLWIDLRSYRASPELASTSDRQFPLLAAKIAAHIRDMSPDDLWSQEVRQQKKARRLALSAASGLLVLAVAAISAFVVAERNRQEANAEGLRLIASRALLLAQTDPMSGLALALERTGDAGKSALPLPEVLQSLTDPMLDAHELRLLSRGTRFATSVDQTRSEGRTFLQAKFFPSGRIISATSRDGGLSLWDVKTGKLIAEPSRPAHESGDGNGDHKTSMLEISDDGSRIITAFPGRGGANLWNGEDGRHVARLNTNGEYPAYISVNRQSRHVAVVDHGGRNRIFDLETGASKGEAQEAKHAGKCDGLTGKGNVIACSPQGDRAVTSTGKELAVWDVQTRQQIGNRSSSNYSSCPSSVSEHHFSLDGTVVLLVADEDEVCVADLASGRIFAGLTDKSVSAPFGDAQYREFAISPDGRKFAEARPDGLVRLWQRDSGVDSLWRLTRLKGHVNRVLSVNFSPDGALLLSTSMDGTMRLWDAGRVRSRSSELVLLSQSDIGRMSEGDAGTAIILHEGTADFIDRRTGSMKSAGVGTLTERSPMVIAQGFASTSDKTMLVFGGNSEVAIRQVGVAAPVRIPTGLNGATNEVVWDDNGGRIAVTTSECRMSIVALQPGIGPQDRTRGLVPRIGSREGGQTCDIVFVSGRNRFIAAKTEEGYGDNEGGISLLDLESGQRIALLPWQQEISSLRFSPDGRFLVATSSNSTAAIWDVPGARLLHSLQDTSGALLAIWSEATGNGGRVAFGNTFEPVQVWDLASGRQIATLIGHDFGAELAAFSSDGRLLVTASQGGFKLRGGPVVVWDISSTRPLARLTGLSRAAEAVGFSRDGTLVVAHSETITEYGHQALVWRIEPRITKLRDDALALVTRCLTQEQRAALFLPPEPPRWCIEQEKWPYDAPAWRQWLADQATGKRPSLP